jgi:hypothetical protein
MIGSRGNVTPVAQDGVQLAAGDSASIDAFAAKLDKS